MSVKDNDLGFAKAITQMKALADKEIKIGIQADETAKYEDGVSVLDVAVWNEFGTANIPSRPFIRQCFALHSEEAYQRLVKAVEVAEKGGNAELALRLVGEWYEGRMKNVLTTHPWAPNSKATIKRKGSSRPLIDTKQLLNSIRYKVE